MPLGAYAIFIETPVGTPLGEARLFEREFGLL
jgi:hypothetical protein